MRNVRTSRSRWPRQPPAPPLVDAYLTHLAVERRLAANSIEGYARDLDQLAGVRRRRRRETCAALDRADLEAFVRAQMTEGRSPRSVARSVAGVRGFYKYLVVDGRLTSSPAADLRPPRAWKTLPKYLSIDEVDALLAQPDVATPRGLRDRALIELVYATGLRVSELVGLRPTDVNLEASFVTCIGKGGKERAVPIGDEAAAWMRALPARRRGRSCWAAAPARGCSSTRAARAPG